MTIGHLIELMNNYLINTSDVDLTITALKHLAGFLLGVSQVISTYINVKTFFAHRKMKKKIELLMRNLSKKN
jgi:hypothetical protein